MNGLDQEEQVLLQAFEAGELGRAADFAERKKRHQEYAEAMFRKDARINIRLSSRDLRALQKKALAEGIPYQTLVASILHKYVEGRLHEERYGGRLGVAS
jgi:predicted DNA binding CopG/RHH family protein